MKINSNYTVNNNIGFNSYNKLNPKTNMSTSTSFYHDLITLKKAVGIIEKNFPKGADILVYAGSNGEEAISVYSLFKNPENYTIYSIDPYRDAIEYAKRGIYSVHRLCDDGFIINDQAHTEDEIQAGKCLSNCLEEIEKPPFKLNNLTDLIYFLRYDSPAIIWEKFYKLKPAVRNNIKFIEGDIRDINSFKTDKPVGGIFFRNALYHLTNNNLFGVLEYGDKPDMEIDRCKILNELITTVDKKLAVNGIFVMGNHSQEHLYMADNHTPQNEKVPFKNIYLMTTPPHIEAILKNGHFKKCYEQEIPMPWSSFSIKMPLIWEKME